jgi:hypothetical protein
MSVKVLLVISKSTGNDEGGVGLVTNTLSFDNVLEANKAVDNILEYYENVGKNRWVATIDLIKLF